MVGVHYHSPATPVRRLLPPTMASIYNELDYERIKIIIQCPPTTSLVNWSKAPLQSHGEDDNPYQAINSSTGYIHTPGLLTIPLEIRWQIFGYLLRADNSRICPHARFPYVFLHTKRSDHPGYFHHSRAAPNNICFPALLINRQLYLEMKPILYSENILYFEHCLTRVSSWPGFPQELLAAIGPNIKHIGFPLEPPIESGLSKEASMKGAERLKAELKLLSTQLPNLTTTRVDLFSTSISEFLCQRFLVSLVRSCQLLPGKKTIIVHGSNHRKVGVGNSLRIHLNGCSDLVLLGGCSCAPFLVPSQPRLIMSAREQSETRPDLLGNWVLQQSNCSQKELATYTRIAQDGSVFVSSNAKIKGPRMGCLLCTLGAECVHGSRYTPTRKGPFDKTKKKHRFLLI